MRINYFRPRFTNKINLHRNTRATHRITLDTLNKLNNTANYTRIGDMITLKDGTTFNANEVPKLNVGLLQTATAKGNVMDFGTSCYFKYTNSSGKNIAIFSMPGGAICRPASEDLDNTEYDKETQRYMKFWNHLGSGGALMGESNDQVCSYLDEAGISKGFFTVKIGSATSEFFYSNSKNYPIYKKKDYDFRYYTMTSPDFSYNKSVFRCLEPGTEITIAGEKYKLKDDFTLDIPYGTDIYDILVPKHTPVSKVPANIDCRA